MPATTRKRSWEEHVTCRPRMQYSYDDLDIICCYGITHHDLKASQNSQPGHRERCVSLPECHNGAQDTVVALRMDENANFPIEGSRSSPADREEIAAYVLHNHTGDPHKGAQRGDSDKEKPPTVNPCGPACPDHISSTQSDSQSGKGRLKQSDAESLILLSTPNEISGLLEQEEAWSRVDSCSTSDTGLQDKAGLLGHGNPSTVAVQGDADRQNLTGIHGDAGPMENVCPPQSDRAEESPNRLDEVPTDEPVKREGGDSSEHVQVIQDVELDSTSDIWKGPSIFEGITKAKSEADAMTEVPHLEEEPTKGRQEECGTAGSGSEIWEFAGSHKVDGQIVKSGCETSGMDLIRKAPCFGEVVFPYIRGNCLTTHAVMDITGQATCTKACGKTEIPDVNNESGSLGSEDFVKLRVRQGSKREREQSRLDSMVLLIMKLDQLDQDIEHALNASPISARKTVTKTGTNGPSGGDSLDPADLAATCQRPFYAITPASSSACMVQHKAGMMPAISEKDKAGKLMSEFLYAYLNITPFSV